MQSSDLQQIRTIITNIDANHKKVPFFTDLQKHAVYGAFFANLDGEDIVAIQDLINTYIEEKIIGLSTKGGEMFRRCYALHKDDFRAFRALNNDMGNVESEEFQQLGKMFEQELYKFEGILTKNMLKKAHGLDKTITAFYDIVYSFFPLFAQVK